MIRLDAGQFGWDYFITNLDTDEDVLEQRIYLQTDWDYPSVASSFGWVIPCECGSSDGTVDCPCGTALDFISAARDYLDDNIGKIVEDPGYFG